MTALYVCEVCQSVPQWRLDRRGDAVVSWACDEDLYTVCHNLQRDWEITEIVISNWIKRREWTEVARSLDQIAGPAED